MNRFAPWTVSVLAGAVFALFDLVTGWTATLGVAAIAVLLVLFAAAVGLYAPMIFAGVRDRRDMRAARPEALEAMAHAGRAIRWSGLFAVGAAVLLFANCTGSLTPADSVTITSAHQDPQSFSRQALLLELPLLLALALPPVLASLAQLRVSRRLAELALWSVFVLLAVCVISTVGGLATGVAFCGEFGAASIGACAAGAGATTNLLSLLALALYLPYVIEIRRAAAWATAR